MKMNLIQRECPKRQYCVALYEDTIARLEEIAQAENAKLQTLVRSAVNNFLSDYDADKAIELKNKAKSE